MKKIVLLIIVFAGVGLALLSFTSGKDVRAEKTGFAVIELFTSQGCSSCPAADKLLSEIVKEKNDTKVFGLSFHVSYWNYLGWKDPYSSKEYTQRQRDYGAFFRNSSIYTPQMVVNGKREFVGSSQANAKKAIEEALSQPAVHHLNLDVKRTHEELIIHYDMEGPLNDVVLNIALVERNIATEVKRGENRNRTLRHDNVVRSFKSIPARKKGQLMLPFANNPKLENGSVIAYVQNKGTFEISGATGIELTVLK
ncbi:DUF1223 domain-containing protein [Fulvivirga sp. M361]|uniref:DUF1223 domain-containing protein n=1 Tax=Fulvivirga sp. M361 TaxID=2594266 RepID=UPI00117AA0F6|nr:DUF1223 domain-containing protein [Fulvivirga sp. M361]TRX61825.1 DUF1223 domain-containing protein [Fulvivirga sp. M361]